MITYLKSSAKDSVPYENAVWIYKELLIFTKIFTRADT